MKRALLTVITFFFLVACKKNNSFQSGNLLYMQNVQKSLKVRVAKEEFEQLQFDRAILSKVDSVSLYLVRIPYAGKKIEDQFLLLQTDKDGWLVKGKIVNLIQTSPPGLNTKARFDGWISIKSLDKMEVIESEILDGYITTFHPKPATLRTLVVPSEKNVLPEVVVVTYVKAEGSFSHSSWVSLMGILGGSSGGEMSTGAYYSSLSVIDGGGGGGGGGYVVGGSGSTGYSSTGNDDQTYSGRRPVAGYTEEEPIFVDIEMPEDFSAIDISKFLKCFSSIPDNGATCSIEILADIPVDNDPNKFFNWSTGSPGHTFIQISKSNGSQNVTQNIGFYPVSGWKTIFTTDPIESKLVDNGKHEFNASLKMNLTTEQLKKALNQLEHLSTKKYDIDEYNCTDLALEVFNLSRANPLVIPRYHIPNGSAYGGTSTPQGLYQQLKSMQRSGVETNNINIPGVKGWVSSSDGSCN
jgi:hypothetical protein